MAEASFPIFPFDRLQINIFPLSSTSCVRKPFVRRPKILRSGILERNIPVLLRIGLIASDFKAGDIYQIRCTKKISRVDSCNRRALLFSKNN